MRFQEMIDEAVETIKNIEEAHKEMKELLVFKHKGAGADFWESIKNDFSIAIELLDDVDNTIESKLAELEDEDDGE
jgi:hypothetical protein